MYVRVTLKGKEEEEKPVKCAEINHKLWQNHEVEITCACNLIKENSVFLCVFHQKDVNGSGKMKEKHSTRIYRYILNIDTAPIGLCAAAAFNRWNVCLCTRLDSTRLDSTSLYKCIIEIGDLWTKSDKRAWKWRSLLFFFFFQAEECKQQ